MSSTPIGILHYATITQLSPKLIQGEREMKQKDIPLQKKKSPLAPFSSTKKIKKDWETPGPCSALLPEGNRRQSKCVHFKDRKTLSKGHQCILPVFHWWKLYHMFILKPTTGRGSRITMVDSDHRFSTLSTLRITWGLLKITDISTPSLRFLFSGIGP